MPHSQHELLKYYFRLFSRWLDWEIDGWLFIDFYFWSSLAMIRLHIIWQKETKKRRESEEQRHMSDTWNIMHLLIADNRISFTFYSLTQILFIKLLVYSSVEFLMSFEFLKFQFDAVALSHTCWKTNKLFVSLIHLMLVCLDLSCTETDMAS